MQKIFAIAALSIALAMPAHADHHGRGKEQLNGFPGIYTLRLGTATFTHDGYLVMVVDSSNVAVSVMSYSIEDGVMTLQDVSPPAFLPEEVQACVRENAATYDMIDQEHGFKLAVKDEPCAARGNIFNDLEFRDYVRPEEREAAAKDE